MHSYLSFFQNLENKACQPDHKFFPDPDQRQELYLKNRSQLRANILFLLLYQIASIIFNFQASSHLFWLGFTSLHVTSLLCFGRTRIWICHWIYTPSVTFGQLVFISLMKDSFIFALIVSFMTPLFVMGVTKNIKHVLFNFFAQLILLQVKYKYTLLEVLTEMEPAEFSQKFVTAASSALIAITVCYTLMFTALQESQKQLKISKVQIEEAYSKLTLFLQTFSHELRNPLNSLLGNLQLVLQETLTQKAYEMVETAKVCGDILLQLINNILDTKKAQTGKLDISPAPVRMTEYITGMWRISRDLMKRKQLDGCLRIDKELPPVLNLDSYRINQVLLNLVSNAIKFTDKGRIEIIFNWIPSASIQEKCFSPCPYDDEGLFDKDWNVSRNLSHCDRTIYLSSGLSSIRNLDLRQPGRKYTGILKMIVRDTGAGIKKEDMKLLFTKFSQVGTDLTKRKVGTGLGLYITKEICEAMGGEIRVYSKEHIGTTFIVCVPALTVNNCEQLVDVPHSIMSLKSRKLSILVVDDNIFNLDLLRNYAVKIESDVVDVARNGLEGYNKYKNLIKISKTVDFIFLDIDMPVMDGKTMCKKIREYEIAEKLVPIKIIFVTGNYDESQMKELVDRDGLYRGSAFIKKPISFEVFVKTLGKLINM